MIAIPHSTNPELARSARVGAVAANQPMSVAVALNVRDQAGLDRFVAQVSDPKSPLYRHFLTAAQFKARYSPTDAQVARVSDFLTAQGLRVSGVAGNRTVVDATGTAGQIQHAFSTTEGVYRVNGRQYYANDNAVTLPGDIAGLVSSVSGLDNAAVRHTLNTKPNHRPRASSGYSASQLATAYNTGSLGTGSGTSVALWEFDGYQPSNISTYDSQSGFSSPAPSTVSVDSANYDKNPGQGQGEVELDIEIVQAIAHAANTYVYEAPNTDQGQIDMAAKIASDDKVKVTSISWGQCETQSAASTISSTDTQIKAGTAEGISYFAAAGDSGSDDCGDGTTAVDYPASDPNVIGVGGTSLTTGSGGSYGSESTWNSGNGATGGGVSTVFSTPSYQQGSNGHRTVPDVASDADPNTGYAIYSAGSWQVFGGTSCAAPMWAGFTALYDASKSTDLGDGHQAIYNVGNGSSYGSAFHDVTSGSNGAYSAGPGYDETTGWGSYNGANLASAL
ncbi:MAG TPA: S53 family peptidase [Pseudonocardiaceae bacterium]|jgi:kumamolisin|nr:S53 family peptidase [Pseudonocardiaceae bacterium]